MIAQANSLVETITLQNGSSVLEVTRPTARREKFARPTARSARIRSLRITPAARNRYEVIYGERNTKKVYVSERYN